MADDRPPKRGHWDTEQRAAIGAAHRQAVPSVIAHDLTPPPVALPVGAEADVPAEIARLREAISEDVPAELVRLRIALAAQADWLEPLAWARYARDDLKLVHEDLRELVADFTELTAQVKANVEPNATASVQYMRKLKYDDLPKVYGRLLQLEDHVKHAVNEARTSADRLRGLEAAAADAAARITVVEQRTLVTTGDVARIERVEREGKIAEAAVARASKKRQRLYVAAFAGAGTLAGLLPKIWALIAHFVRG